jgi:hypothetical protein
MACQRWPGSDESSATESHEVLFFFLPRGDVTDDQRALIQSGDIIPWGGLVSVPPGGRLMTTIEFEPGTYQLSSSGNNQIITVR